jgi:hypothetical protein
MDANAGTEPPTTELPCRRGYPEPSAVISLRRAVTYRDLDEDGHPILIITDGVTTVALDSGLSGLSPDVVAASQRLAEAVADFARSIMTCWQRGDGTSTRTAALSRDAGPPVGRHRPARHLSLRRDRQD